MSTNYPPSIAPPQPSSLTPSTAPSTTSSYPNQSANPLQPSPLSTSTLPNANSKGTFTYPTSYSFPPFFTLQPNTSTQHAQLQKWSSLIQSYCRHHRLFKLSLTSSLDTDLFYNRKINRRMEREDVREVVEFMRKEGRADWVYGLGGKREGDGGGEFWVWWRNVEEWAGLIAEWVDETAQKNTVLTLYELTESEATLSQDFHGMDPDLLQKALAVLVKRGKAQVFGQEDQQGVKFF